MSLSLFDGLDHPGNEPGHLLFKKNYVTTNSHDLHTLTSIYCTTTDTKLKTASLCSTVHVQHSSRDCNNS